MKRSPAKSLSWLNTPIVLYLVVALALSNLFFFLYKGDVRHTIIFVLVGVITSFFSKNMIVILTMAIAFTSIAKMVSIGRLEGMTDGEDDTENTDAVSSSEPDANSATDKKKKEDATENMEGKEGEDEEEEKESFEMIKKDGQELIKVQDKIEAGFKELDPYMDKADQLLTRIEESMTTLEKKQLMHKKK